MDMASASKVSTIRKFAFVAIGVSLIAQTVSPCLALGLSSSKKNTALQYEVYSKMSPGAGPQTNDLQKQVPQLDNSPATAAKPVDLSPVTMDEGDKTADTSLGPSEEGVFKATVKRDHVATSGPIEQTDILKPKSVKPSSRGGSVAEQARYANAMPLPLQSSNDEDSNKEDVKFNAEKLELADLWDSTLARSQDIQFVVQKLMPSNNSGKTANVMMKMLSATVFGGMSMMTMMAPNMGAQVGANMGASMMMQALNGVQGNADKKARLSQDQAINLYRMVRETADKVVNAYKDYKLSLNACERRTNILTKLQGTVNDVRAGQTAVQQIEMEGVLMRYKADVEEEAEKVARYRQQLVDLSGSEAVAKLDKQLEIDKQRIEEAGIAQSAPAAPATPPADGTLVAPTNGAVPN
ncbi:MAG: hypothetical protein JST89_02760 [Cyanobacteria bacterium SZAS-4]|nr:hypothetical protein [Cyanobacteria bacterium SZAS-4]